MLKTKITRLFAACTLSFLFLVISKKLGLSWVEISGVFLAVLGFGATVWQGLKSINDSEQSSIEKVRQELLLLINGIKRELVEKDKLHDKDLEYIKEKTASINLVIEEQGQINRDITGIMRDIEQLSAALAQNSKYTELLKRQSNIEKLLKSEKTKSYQTLIELLTRIEKIEKGESIDNA